MGTHKTAEKKLVGALARCVFDARRRISTTRPSVQRLVPPGAEKRMCPNKKGRRPVRNAPELPASPYFELFVFSGRTFSRKPR